MLYLACDLRPTTLFVGAIPCRFPLGALQRRATHRAGLDKFYLRRSRLPLCGVDSGDLWDDLPGLLHIEAIPFVDVKVDHDIFIME